ncbi:dethiobiotin synthase [Clostridium gasigenes]|uniref:ATP-dependent dethiobiotin synthetase BioD n=1 Tax=Clostridium gasigenes TaxID=94869 RepID=A0A1H0VQB6_9CLOT|nr:dethiobiotin synthase [Clostridium gasigenes]MBB6624888.1 dethiobiotin synthase [Clostridium gasigenes]MBU3089561.1 dethiobiotin synthase [Clostridium gasigenes]SDP80563.1 dethiobiotin synthase [Clostridium gasigenes]
MNKSIFIVGTDTDVGKTFVTGLIIKSLRDNGINAGYFKAALSGAREEGNKLIPGDAEEVCNVSGIEEEYSNMVSYILKNPYSPHLAARIENIEVSLDKIKNDYKNLKEKYECLVVEGSGGIICPLKIKDDEVILLEDVIKVLNLETILIARAEIGTINHTTLTVKYLESIGIKVKAIVLNGYNPQNIIHKDNKETIKVLTGVNNFFEIPFVDERNQIVDNYFNFNLLINIINK